MIEEILPGFYRVQLPFPKNPLRNINCYVARADGKSLIIDTGIDLDESRETMLSGLRELGVDLKKTDFFITHMHRDHIGLLSKLISETSVVYFNRPDAAFIRNNQADRWQERIKTARKHGFPEGELEYATRHPRFQFFERDNLDFHFLKQDDVLAIGDYRLRCIETPGHTRGHICLYEPDNKFLLSGDHVLVDISPNISAWNERDNPLADYLTSLDKVYGLDVRLVLPGHRRIFRDMRHRIDELKQHHQQRLEEALTILEDGGKNAYRVASQMTWDLSYETWELIPVWQKFFCYRRSSGPSQASGSSGENRPTDNRG